MIRQEVRYRYWCTVCRSGSPGAYLTVAECDPWQEMHERTDHHHDTLVEYLFLALLDAGSSVE